MKTNLQFDFIVNKETQTVTVKREFEANLDLVWSAWTEPEILDQWWAPKPYVSKTKSMDFKVGGRRLYVMCGPNGEEHWCLADYTSISSKSNFSYRDAFCDNLGNIDTTIFPGSNWSINFIDKGDTTLVDVIITHNSLSDLEKIIAMGFKDGFTIAINGLDDLLSILKNKSYED